MKTGVLWSAILLLTLYHQVSTTEDLYWEGEEEASNEFLEVNEDTAKTPLKRLKRQFSFFNFFGSTTTTTAAPENYEAITEDQDDTIFDNKDDDDRIDGSGAPDSRIEPDVGEKTLRVTFVVMEPYKDEYSNRDALLFQNLSRTLADAVNVLFEKLPGTQKASLVRIQSRLADEFSCKVTLDIVTTGFDDTNRITEVLRDHIRKFGKLGHVIVKDADFSANVVNPGSAFETCQSDEIQCGDGRCVPGYARCNGVRECYDGADEVDCNVDAGSDDSYNQLGSVDQRVDSQNTTFQQASNARPSCSNPIPCASSSVTYCEDKVCDGFNDCPLGDDEKNCGVERGDQSLTGRTARPDEETTIIPTRSSQEACEPGEFTCDETRCIQMSKRCDGEADCYDGTDEADCKSKQCGDDDFRCNNGKCIERNRRCDAVVDCQDGEDELDCTCSPDEFRCVSDGACIEGRKKCDSVVHCRDGSDERDCACSSGQWQCDLGNCIKRSKRCNGKVDCPSDRSDERNCVANGYFKCISGTMIPETLRCNRHYDCPDGDYSDEQNCPCGIGDFKCNNGHCIPASKRCDRSHDCQDGSDEQQCLYGTTCMAYEFKCTSGQCVHSESYCNGTVECEDGSDEQKCPCKRGQFRCRDGSCINIARRCNGRRDCVNGDDELNCECPAGTFTCDRTSRVQCAIHCNNITECDDGEDEDDCDECHHECDGRCLSADLICNQEADCTDGSDELNCDNCDGPEDFRCDNGECIKITEKCNNVPECADGSDERPALCNASMSPTQVGCLESQFKCRDGTCINIDFLCDRRNDCNDGSDEENCPWYMVRSSRSPSTAPCRENEFTCYNGICIPLIRRCDNLYDCTDFSDEQNCPSACANDEFRCWDGQCVPSYLRCDGKPDCNDRSDETNCDYPNPSEPPVQTTTNRYDDRYVPGREPGSPPNRYDPYGRQTGGRDDNPDEETQPDEPTTPESETEDDRYDPYGQTPAPNESDRSPDGGYPDNSNRYDPYGQTPAPNESDRSPDGGYPDNSNPYAPTSQPDYPQPNDPYNRPVGQPYQPDLYGGGTTTSQPNYQQPDPYGSGSSGGQPGYPDSGSDPYATGSPRGYPQDPYESGTTQSPYSGPGGDPYGSGGYPGYPQPPGAGSDPYGSGGSSGYPQQPGGSSDPYGSGGSSGYPQQPGGGDPYGSGGSSGYPQQPGGRSDPYGSGGSSGYPQQPGGSSDPNGSGGSSGYPQQPDGGRDPYGSGGSSGYPQQPDGGRDPNGSGGSSGYPEQPRAGDPYGSGGSSGYPGQPGGGDPYGSGGSSGYPQQPGGGDPYGSGGSSGYPQPNGDDRYNTSPGSQPGYPQSGDQYGSNASPYPGSGGDNGASGGSGYGGEPGYNPEQGSSGAGGGSVRGGSVACKRNEWRCENGPCIDARRRCDGHIDCPFDYSDEFDCPPGSPVTLNLKTYPSDQSVRTVEAGGDVVFQCRDEGPVRAPVRWVREGAKPLKSGYVEKNGRLELYTVTMKDAGVYICQTPNYLRYPGSQVRVTLNVQKPDKASATARPPFIYCKPYEATCGNGDCIPKSAVCDGNYDCADRSDEDMCKTNGLCEPNQFQCPNRKCMLLSWMCDGDDDCGDGSDEENCGPSDPSSTCTPVEFACSSDSQCVPRSFHCDGRRDCFDGSDEVGCAPVHITKPPKPSNVRLNPGDTLMLTCDAVGTPTPIITWRLNWGHVPKKCTISSKFGVGNLTCPNMQPEDSGAYSCEAMNNRGTVFATPDAIVFVSRTDPCRSGYFNSEARSESECIRCFCFGESNQCKSADLFTYNMPTPLGEGGTRLLGVALTADGEFKTDPSINNHYYYQPMRNGAAVTKLVPYDQNWLGNFHPYLTLPESYNGNQLTSYGGHIKYSLSAHARSYTPDDSAPAIIVKGKYASLFHNRRSDPSRDSQIEVRLTPENWQKNSSRGFIPASREDIMMALDHIDMILLRADLNNAGVNITDFSMESAHHINVGLGAASLVEECTCPPGYEGLSCQKCAAGYVRERSGPWLGNCVRESCPPGTYGDPASGYACRPCPCPLTNRDNQFARTCALGPDGTVSCDCFPGYEGKNCEICAPGYEGNPLVAGDSCRVKPADKCNPVGTRNVRVPDDCVCKDNVQGRYCDQCKNDSFYLSNDFRHGCALCFCSGVSQQCMSSNLRRKVTSVQFNVPSIVDEVKIYNSAPAGSGAVRYTAPVETTIRPVLTRGGLTLAGGLDRSRPTVYYWSMPPNKFSEDKVTSYGGFLRYTLDNVPSYVDPRLKNNAADIQLISKNHLTFQYVGNFQPSPEGILNASVQFLEKGWQRSDGKEVSREHFLLALADVKAILIKATYSADSVAIPISASIETAESGGDGPAALHVEQCVCPSGYIGTSCEDCAPGYTRSSSGLYLEHCDPCDCNGHSRNCHPETGVCYDCMDNTDGPNCELCKPGYERDRYDNCVEIDQNSITGSPCRCDPRGAEGPCDDDGRCVCKLNVEGYNCDRCRPGTFGLDANNPDGCISCFCSGVTTDCQPAHHYTKILVPAPIFGDNFGGYTLMDLNAENVYKEDFVPVPDKSELMYVFNFPAGNRELYWSLPVFPGNRVLAYNGSLQLRQEFRSNNYDEVSRGGVDVVLIGDDVSVYWTNQRSINSGESLSYQVPLVEEGWYLLNSVTPATRGDFMRVLKNVRRVLVRATIAENLISTSIADVSMETATETSQPDAPPAKGVEICSCPPGHLGTSCESCAAGYYKDRQDYCTACPCNGHDCQLDPYGQVTCNCQPPYTGSDCSAIAGESSQTTTPRSSDRPQASVTVKITSPTIMIQEIGSSVNFTCQAQSPYTSKPLPVTWTKVDGDLPQGRTYVDAYAGLLTITNLQISDSGQYICQTYDGLSTGQALVTLKVPANDMTLPSVTINPPVNDYYEGDRIQLECIATGNPTPTISWQRASGLPLPLSAEHYDELFIIESAREEYSGEYRCIASNTAGSSDRIAIISVRPRPSRPLRDRLMVTPTDPTVNEGQSTRVVCTGSTNVPAGTIDWIRQDGDRFQPNVRSDNGVLYIDNAIEENRGVYVCQTHAADVAPVPIVLNVVSQGTPPPGQEPGIDVPIKSLRVATGETGTVDCNPRGYPPPQIKWSKYQGDFGRGTSQRGDMLIINNAEESDHGYYVCEGIVNNQIISKVYVLVEIEKREEPRVQIWPEGEQPVALGDQFEFHCRVISGTPEPDVMWSRSGGRTLSQDTHIKQHNVLRFDRVDVNDEGEYICTGSNLAGSHSASAVLKVRSPPVINITPNNYLEVRKGDPVNVECRANGYPEPEVSITGPNNQLMNQPAPGIAAIRIISVTEAEDGDYTCTATSAAGTTSDTFIIRVDRGDGGFGANAGNTIDAIPFLNGNRASDLVAAEGQREITIYCNVSGGYEPQWGRGDRQPLQFNARQVGSRLVIYNVSKSDSGPYVCSVYNYETREAQTAAYTSLLVVGTPKITLRPPTQTVLPGQSPIVECVVEGDDIIDIIWRPYNRDLSRRVKIRNSTLIFQQIEVEDAGKYECFARNKYANASAIAEVIVAEENDVESEFHESEVSVRAGADVSLSCNVTLPAGETKSVGSTSVKWTKDGRSLPRSVRLKPDGSLFIKLAHHSDSGHYVCHIRDTLGRISSNYVNLHIEGPQDEIPALMRIEQPNRRFRAGENVEVLCKTLSRGTNVRWDKWDAQGTRQYVETRTYGDGAILIIHGVTESDAGVYRCTGYDSYGRTSSEDFNLEVEPGSGNQYPRNRDTEVAKYTARLGQTVDMPCNYDLEEPVNIQWRREYASLPSDTRTEQPMLHLNSVSEGDAGTYVCRVSNSHTVVEAKAILRVVGVVPSFKGNGWIALPTLRDAYRQFDIEISFKPQDADGLILYNSQYNGRQSDFLALQLVDGVPEFILETGSGPVSVKGDRPLELNEWHTIRLSKIGSRVTMDVDNIGPAVNDTTENWVLELQEPLYIGGVPNYDELPAHIAGAAGFAGCVSMLILGSEEKNIMLDSLNKFNVYECDTCAPNLCLNDAVCQEARNERGFICICANGFAGANCDRRGEACRPGLCGSGKCTDTTEGYKCACPVTHTGRNCEIRQSIEYPAFTGSAYLALKPPNTARFLKMSMKVKATAPVTDGIIMYCAESPRGLGGFTSLAVRNGRLEFRYDVGDGNPVVLVSNTTLPANEWTDVQITRSGPTVSLVINLKHKYEQRLDSVGSLRLETPMFVGGVDESIILNNNTGVSSGFMGCIKQLKTHGVPVDIVNSSIQSANVQECSNYDRGDIPEMESPCPCINGGTCAADGSCICPSGFTGYNCETRLPSSLRTQGRSQADPCAVNPCRNGGTCKTDYKNVMNYSCDCPLGFAGASCQMNLDLYQSVGFNGNGYLELPAALVNYEDLDREPAIIALAIHTTQNGVLLYQREALAVVGSGDYIMIRIEKGFVVLEWDMGSGATTLTIDDKDGFVTDGERHQIIVKFLSDNKVELTVDSNTVSGYTTGLANLMSADSNIYIGGIPDNLNLYRYPGLDGCIEQIEFMNAPRGLNLGFSAVAGRNTQRCKRYPGTY